MLEGIVRAKQDLLDRAAGSSRCCRSCCTATPRSPARASSPRPSTCRSCAATAPAARSTSSSTTRSASPPLPSRRARRSTPPTSPRMIQAPIFHVNGDDPEAVVRVARLAFEFRQAFHKDVVIDMVCYRRRGHNEGDDPSLTQPLMYNLIDAKRSVRKLYTEALIGRGDITVEEAEQALRDYQEQLERVFAETRDATGAPDRRSRRARLPAAVPARWSPPRSPTRPSSGSCDASVNMPEGFTVHPRLAAAAAAPRADGRRTARSTGRIGEMLAFGSLLLEGTHGAARRPGLAPRHVRPAPRRDRRPRDRRGVHAAHAPLRRPGASFYVYDSLLVGVRRDGLRVRLLGGPPRGAGAVGGAVRRLRQRRADDHRRVHHLRRAEVGPAVRRRRCCCRTATRARAPTTPPRASSASCRCARRTT